MKSLTLERDKNGAFFETVYADMQKQFPLCEMKSREAVLRLLKCGRYHLLIAFDDKMPVGYLIVYLDSRSHALWLDYFAVFKPFHGKGYGSHLLPLLKKNYSQMRGCYLEVEKPEMHKIDSIRRVRFYRRNGARRLDLDYLYPYAGGVFPMHLFFLPFDMLSEKMLTPEVVFATIQRVFHDIHPDISHVEDVLRRIRRNLKRREKLKLEFLKQKGKEDSVFC